MCTCTMHPPPDECARVRRWVPCCLEPQRAGGEWADCPNGAFPIPAGPGKGWRRGNSELLPALAQALSLERASDIWVFSDVLSHLPIQVRNANPIYGACIPLCRTNAGPFIAHSPVDADCLVAEITFCLIRKMSLMPAQRVMLSR